MFPLTCASEYENRNAFLYLRSAPIPKKHFLNNGLITKAPTPVLSGPSVSCFSGSLWSPVLLQAWRPHYSMINFFSLFPFYSAPPPKSLIWRI